MFCVCLCVCVCRKKEWEKIRVKLNLDSSFLLMMMMMINIFKRIQWQCPIDRQTNSQSVSHFNHPSVCQSVSFSLLVYYGRFSKKKLFKHWIECLMSTLDLAAIYNIYIMVAKKQKKRKKKKRVIQIYQYITSQ